jgi:hypothetical protein
MPKSTMRCLLAAALCVALAAAPASATSLADLLPNLIGLSIVLDNPGHAAHFQASGKEAGESFNRNLVEQLSNVPLTSSAGGFSFSLDPTLGTFSRSTESFGPVFTERAQTIGKGKWNLGFNYLQSNYDKIDDLDLRGGHLIFQAAHEDCCPPPGGNPPSPFFEGDVITVQTSLKVETKTTVFYANVGASDRFDIAVAVPVVKIDLDGRAHLTIRRLSTANLPQVHRFPGGSDTADFVGSDSSSGIGDVVVRGKFRFHDFAGGGLAAALDVRLPTGSEKDLLGAGYTQTKLSLIASGGSGRAGLHANLGYSVASGSSDIIQDPPDELHYALGLDLAVHPRATVVGEVVGRTLYDASRAVLTTQTHTFRVGSDSGPVNQAQLPVVQFERDDLQLLLGSLAVKFNPAGNLLITAGALFQLGSDGLRNDGVTGVVGAEYSF